MRPLFFKIRDMWTSGVLRRNGSGGNGSAGNASSLNGSDVPGGKFDETEYLLSTPANRERLYAAMKELDAGRDASEPVSHP